MAKKSQENNTLTLGEFFSMWFNYDFLSILQFCTLSLISKNFVLNIGGTELPRGMKSTNTGIGSHHETGTPSTP